MRANLQKIRTTLSSDSKKKAGPWALAFFGVCVFIWGAEGIRDASRHFLGPSVDTESLRPSKR